MTDVYQDIEAQIPRLRRYARSLVRDATSADDLVQECLVRALAKLHLWQEGSNLRAWLFAILHNQHINRLRRQMRSGTTVEFDEAELPGRAPLQDKRLELRDLGRALGQLPEAQRAVVLLVGLEGMRYDDVSAALGIPIGTVRSRLARGRSALRRLTGAGPDWPDKAAAKTVIPRRETQYPPTKAGHLQADSSRQIGARNRSPLRPDGASPQ